MELRVWTDGIERVVCGVTDVTTCRDVIVALARTAGKTGRYWLIETCHGRQRRLPAAERLLARWPERAGSGARLSLVHGSGPRHDTRSLGGRTNGCVDSRKVSPLNKACSVGCCRSLTADSLAPVSWRKKDELQTERADVTGITSMSKSLPNFSVDHRMATTNIGCVHATDQPRGGRNAQQRQVSARLARPHLSPSSASSCSSGEFVPPVHSHPVSHVPERSASKHDTWVEHSTLTRHKLQSMSREQLLRLLSRQREEISRREAELSDLGPEVSATEENLQSLKHSEQSLGVKLSELEATERKVNEELEELELVSWQDKLDMETSRCAQLEADAEALTSSIVRSDAEIDRWQQRVYEITAETETIESSSQQMDANKTRLKEQLDNLELKLAESRSQNHDRQSTLQQVEKTIERDAARIEDRLAEEQRLQRQLDISLSAASQFQRSLSFDSEFRAKNKVCAQRSSSQRATVGDRGWKADVAFSCQI